MGSDEQEATDADPSDTAALQKSRTKSLAQGGSIRAREKTCVSPKIPWTTPDKMPRMPAACIARSRKSISSGRSAILQVA